MPPKQITVLYCARQAFKDEVSAFVAKLTEPVGFMWLLQPEPSSKALKLIPAIEDVVFSKRFLDAENKHVKEYVPFPKKKLLK